VIDRWIRFRLELIACPLPKRKPGKGGGTSPGSTSIPTFARSSSLVLLSVSNSSQFAGFSNQLRGCKSRHGYSSGQAARLRALARPQRSPTSVLPPTLVNACERLSPWARPFCPCRPAAGPRFFKPNNAGAIPATDSNGPKATVIESPDSLTPRRVQYSVAIPRPSFFVSGRRCALPIKTGCCWPRNHAHHASPDPSCCGP
jgi:hypothetical protein